MKPRVEGSQHHYWVWSTHGPALSVLAGSFAEAAERVPNMSGRVFVALAADCREFQPEVRLVAAS